jgi:hypothetical protein
VWHAALRSTTVAESLTKEGFAIRAQIIWAKDRLVIGRGDYQWQHEPYWYAVRTLPRKRVSAAVSGQRCAVQVSEEPWASPSVSPRVRAHDAARVEWVPRSAWALRRRVSAMRSSRARSALAMLRRIKSFNSSAA